MTFAIYAELNLFCIFIMVIILHRIATGIDKQTEQRYFIVVLVSEIIMFSLDLIWACVEHQIIPVPTELGRLFNFIFNCAYFIQTGACAFFWLIYSENAIGNNIPSNRKKLIISLIPLELLAVLSVSSYWTGWIFSIDENNHYMRGQFYFVQVILAYGYLIFSAVRAFRKGRDKDNYADRKKYYTISSFVYLPIIFGLLQTISNSLPLVCVGITLSIINIYINSQEQLISIDTLTQINNRNTLLRYLTGKTRQDTPFYLVIMDVDGFKKINDKYGHVEGDMALKKIATALKKIAADKNYFVSRYGGDEFILIGEIPDYEILRISDLINDYVRVENIGAEYDIKLSAGYCKFEGKEISIRQLIENADEMLYRVKQRKKTLRK